MRAIATQALQVMPTSVSRRAASATFPGSPHTAEARPPVLKPVNEWPMHPKNGASTHLGAWFQDRAKVKMPDFEAMKNTPKVSDCTLQPPHKTVFVSAERLNYLKSLVPRHGYEGNGRLYGLPAPRPPEKALLLDVEPEDLDAQTQTLRPGEGGFCPVITGPYGNQAFKYLFVVTPSGITVSKEIQPCIRSSRGIVQHPTLAHRASQGGEVFFSEEDPGTVRINFGSGRFPLLSPDDIQPVAELWLSLGAYDKVIVVCPPDRYGKDLRTMAFVRENANGI